MKQQKINENAGALESYNVVNKIKLNIVNIINKIRKIGILYLYEDTG